MLGRKEHRPFTRGEVRRFLKRDKDERGVASTVGTIMALLVFLTFLTLFTNSYVPVWMTTNERTHMNEVMNQFGDLKGRIDNLVAMASTTGMSSLNMFAPITLGADGVPVFAIGTAGQLNFVPVNANSPQGNSTTVKLSYCLGVTSTIYNVKETGGGLIELYTSNRYYVEQWVGYENGAVLVKQRDGQITRAFPSFIVTTSGPQNNVTLSFTQVELFGKNATVTGTGTTGINIALMYLDQQQYTNLTYPAKTLTYLKPTFTFNSTYGKAWYTYLDNMLRVNLKLTSGTDYTLTAVGSDYHSIKLQMLKVVQFNHNVARMQISVGNA